MIRSVLGGALLALAAAPAPATVRALIVGIDSYPYVPDATLKGAVNDARLLHERLSRAPFALALSAFPAGGARCETRGEAVAVLIDGCATRAAILAAFDALIAASRPGDTILFYFAGHGARSSAIADRQKALTQTSTIVAHDSRRPIPGGTIDDIRGTLLNRHIEAARAAGISIATIFDSCDSGTATRNLDTSRTRSIDPAIGPAQADDPDPPALPAAAQRGGRVHLAAAADGVKAVERPYAETPGAAPLPHGRFTAALIEVIAASPHATYGDILRAVRARIAATPGDQVPKGEGDLDSTTFLGAPAAGELRLFEGTARDGAVALRDGSLSGIANGSTFTLYRSAADARAAAGPIAIARAAKVGPHTAVLTPVRPAALPAVLVAQELARSFGDLALPVAFADLPEADIAAVLKDLPLVRREAREPEVVVARRAGALMLLSATGESLATIGRIAARTDVERIGIALRRVANAKALLNLPEKPAAARMGSLEIRTVCTACAVSPRSRPDTQDLVQGDRFRLLIRNRARARSYPYLFAISPQFAISRLYPPPGASDALEGKDGFYVGDTVTAAATGVTRLVLIMSETPLPAGPLEQGGLPRAGCDVASALAKLLCAAASGTRAADVVPQGDFDVIKLALTIDRKDAP